MGVGDEDVSKDIAFLRWSPAPQVSETLKATEAAKTLKKKRRFPP